MAKWFTAAAAVYLGLVLIKDGTAPKLVQDAASGAKDFLGGIKGLTGAA